MTDPSVALLYHRAPLAPLSSHESWRVRVPLVLASSRTGSGPAFHD